MRWCVIHKDLSVCDGVSCLKVCLYETVCHAQEPGQTERCDIDVSANIHFI